MRKAWPLCNLVTLLTPVTPFGFDCAVDTGQAAPYFLGVNTAPAPRIYISGNFFVGAGPRIMANTILVGAQWGDEGKGKVIDVLTEEADIVVRTQGGN